LVLERDGETLRGWKTLMKWLHWKSGRQVYEINMSDIPNDETGQETVSAGKIIRSSLSVHIVLGLSLLFFIALVILQFIGLIYTGIGLNHALHEDMQEKWCSPAFQIGVYVFDPQCHLNLTNTPHPARGIGRSEERRV